MARNLNQTPEEHDQPTGGTANPKHNPVGPRAHEEDKSADTPHPKDPVFGSRPDDTVRPPQRRR